MTWFADLTPHTYTPAPEGVVLNVGWLGLGHAFSQGDTPADFRAALAELCRHPVRPHRGFHVCEFCPRRSDGYAWSPQLSMRGNGQIRIMAQDLTWYAAPRMIHHYVVAHGYVPPAAFVEAVIAPTAVAVDLRPGPTKR